MVDSKFELCVEEGLHPIHCDANERRLRDLLPPSLAIDTIPHR